MQRPGQQKPPEHIHGKYVGVSQFVICTSYEACFLNCLILFHRRAKHVQFPHFWEVAVYQHDVSFVIQKKQIASRGGANRAE